jgi:hypothetical protein
MSALGFGEVPTHECADGTGSADGSSFRPLQVFFDVHVFLLVLLELSVGRALFLNLGKFYFVPIEVPGILIEVNVVVAPFEFTALKVYVI